MRLVVDDDHYEQLVRRAIARARVSVWIATANVKEMRVEAEGGPGRRFESILSVLDRLAHDGVELRLLHAGTPSRAFRAELALRPRLARGGLSMRQCPRVHLKIIAVDGADLYLGSANFTGAGLGAKNAGRRNFELGVRTDDDLLLDAVQERYDRIWSGRECKGCRLRAECPKPLDRLLSCGPMALPPSVMSSPELSVPAGGFPVVVDLVPGAVVATVSLMRVAGPSGPVECWSYATSGLARWGQREIVLPVGITPGRDRARPPTGPLSLFSSIAQLASQGLLVDDGGVSELGGSGLLGGRGFAYVDAPPLEGSGAQPGSLLALRLTADELAVLREYGVARLLSSWGASFSHYPFPPWSDEARPSVVSLASFSGTLLDSVPRMPLRAWARLEQGVIRLEILADQRPTLEDLSQLPPDAGFALLTRIDPAADGCLVWRAGQREPSAITPPGAQGSRLSGAFVLVAPCQPDDRGRIHEDGFALLLRDASAAALLRALGRGEPLTLPGAGDGLGLSLAWAPNAYRNPVDGSVIAATGGMRSYAPQTPAPRTGPARTSNIVLLTSQDEIAQRVGTDELSAFLRELCSAGEALLARGAGRGGWELMIDVKLSPGARPALQLLTRGSNVDLASVGELEARAAALAGPAVRGPVAFQIFFTVD